MYANFKSLYVKKYLSAGPDPGRCNRCKCIGQKKMTDAFIGQILTANNEKQYTLRKHKLVIHKFQQIYFFLEMSTKHIPNFTSERFVLPKHALAISR